MRRFSNFRPDPLRQIFAADVEQAKQKEELNRLLQTYKNEIQRGQTGSKLKLLAKQIAAAASALGQNVTLPSTPSATSPTASPSTIDVTT